MREAARDTGEIGRLARAAALTLAVLAIAACATLDFRAPKAAAAPAAFPETSFAVFSDAHLFVPELGIGEPSFDVRAQPEPAA